VRETGPPFGVDRRRFDLFVKVLEGDVAAFNIGQAIMSQPGREHRLQAELARLGPDPDQDWTAAGFLRALRRLIKEQLSTTNAPGVQYLLWLDGFNQPIQVTSNLPAYNAIRPGDPVALKDWGEAGVTEIMLRDG